ncbi:hypothetical protein JYU14_04390 [Simkania negevensis]|uniref:Uncharacterized protein n=1 Tax=Simkania negevensis TaxID=83561 RepID=A0ABS3ASD1_9BACT|nr:hypothetical protein [Simkania negevensis]
MAYVETCRVANLQTTGPYPEAIGNNDPRYKAAAEHSRRQLISKTVEQLLGTHGIRKDLAIVETSCAKFCESEGTNTFRGGAATILVARGLSKVDQDAVDWLVTRQLIVIGNDDLFKLGLVRAIAATAVVIFNLYNVSDSSYWFYTILLTIAVQLVAGAVFTLRREIETDAFAIKNASNATLQGGERFLSAFKNCWLGKVPQDKRKVFCGKHSGIDYDGATLQGRIAQIQGELARRGVPNDPGKKDKIKRLEEFLMK